MRSEPAVAPNVETAEGRVYDRGYRHYDGPREGRSSAIRALVIYSIKRGLGIKKRWTAKIIPAMLLAFAFFPVIIIIGIRAFLGPFAEALDYRALYNSLALILLVFAAATAPEMLCDDRRQRVLHLYFARPIHRSDYLLAKLMALGALMGTIAYLPPLLLFLGTMFLADSPLTYLGDHLGDLARIIAAGTLLSSFYAAIGLAVAAFTDRKSIAAAIYIGAFLILSGIAGALFEAIDAGWGRYLALVNPRAIPEGVTLWVFSDAPDPGSLLERAALAGPLYLAAVVAIVAASGAIMYWRYLRDE